MILGDRLRVIAEEIENGETMADIGTDHGFLPIYLKSEGISPHVIMTDISPFSLDKAREDALLLNPDENFDFRVGDGLKVLKPGEVDVVVIAGMGGMLIRDILSLYPAHSKSFGKLILQPRNKAHVLRKYLLENGYEVTRERFVHEGKHICNILVAKPASGGDEEKTYSDEYCMYPDNILDSDREEALEFLKREEERLNELIKNAGKGSSALDEEKIEIAKGFLSRIEEIKEKRKC